jgi:NTE family protein
MRSPIAEIRASRTLARHAPKIIYVLSGGAAKGFCHLGMIEALEARGVTPDLVVGTSAGSLFGALYCHYGNIAEVIARVEGVLASKEFASFEKKYFGGGQRAEAGVQTRVSRFFAGLRGTLKSGVQLGRAMVTSAMIAENDAASIFQRIFDGITFDTLKIPFAAVAVDLVDGALVIFDSSRKPGNGESARAAAGPEGLARAVRASSAIPFVFPAVEIAGHAHADGYIMANLPVREARALAGDEDAFFVGFDVSAPVQQNEEELSPMDLALRLLSLATRSKQAADRELVDVLFQPVDKAVPWSSFGASRELVSMGREYMSEQRLEDFDKAYIAKCAASGQKSGNPLRRLLSRAGLKRLGRRISPRSV